jgi:hypothetical protein
MLQSDLTREIIGITPRTGRGIGEFLKIAQAVGWVEEGSDENPP